VEHLRAYGSGDGLDQIRDELTGVDARITAVEKTEGPSSTSGAEPDAIPVRVFLVGGDERQSKHDDWIREQLAEKDPGVTIEFLRPGWSGNWSSNLDEAIRTLRRVDGVVVMKFMRTVFGRRLRREIEVPWRGCHGAGRNAMLNSILLTAEMARQHIRDRQEALV
jgi:hypothetical protein